MSSSPTPRFVESHAGTGSSHFPGPPGVPTCQHAPLPPHLHLPHQLHRPSHFARATTLPCGVDPRLHVGCPPASAAPPTCHNQADMTASDAGATLAHPSHCSSHQHLHQVHPTCCSFNPPEPAHVGPSPPCCAETAAMQQHKQLHQHLHLQQAKMPEGSIAHVANFMAHGAPDADCHAWSVAQQLRMPSGR